MATEADLPARGADTTMRAVVQDRYGDADVLHVSHIGRPVAKGREVLLRVRAVGLDRGAWHLMTGTPYLIRLGVGLRRPRNPILAHEVAGTVIAVGPAATRFAVGDEVFGAAWGALAEFVAAREDKLARKPAELSFAEAAALPISGITALQALRDAGRVQAGQRVLITGASGGVGTYAVQLAKAFGAEVTGVASAAKLDLVRSLGADHVIDYTSADFADGTHRYDLILDLAGNPALSRLRRALTPTGTAVIAGGEEGGNWTGGIHRQLVAVARSPFARQRFTMMLGRENADDLERLAEFTRTGQVVPRVDQVFPMDRAAQAMRHLAEGKARGKVVVSV